MQILASCYSAFLVGWNHIGVGEDDKIRVEGCYRIVTYSQRYFCLKNRSLNRTRGDLGASRRSQARPIFGRIDAVFPRFLSSLLATVTRNVRDRVPVHQANQALETVM
eukprot:evm.model.NODE_1103_length_1178_cov_26.977079.1